MFNEINRVDQFIWFSVPTGNCAFTVMSREGPAPEDYEKVWDYMGNHLGDFEYHGQDFPRTIFKHKTLEQCEAFKKEFSNWIWLTTAGQKLLAEEASTTQ
jgi:hypothetical protein